MYTKTINCSYHRQVRYFPGMCVPLKGGATVPAEIIIAVMLQMDRIFRSDWGLLSDLANYCHGRTQELPERTGTQQDSPILNKDGTIHPVVQEIVRSAISDDFDIFDIRLQSPLGNDPDGAILAALIKTSFFDVQDSRMILCRLAEQ